MPALTRQIRFCESRDGVRIAYATSGAGAPLVKASNWLSHLEFDWQSPVWVHLLRELSRDHTLIRYDERGCGLSDWYAHLSFDEWVSDLENVVEANNVPRLARSSEPIACADPCTRLARRRSLLHDAISRSHTPVRKRCNSASSATAGSKSRCSASAR